MLGSHTEWAPLEEFTYSANAGHAGENHKGQTQKTNQAAKVENLRQCAKLPPFGHQRYPSFSKYLKLVSTIAAPFFKDFDRLDSQNPAYPCDDVGKG